MVLLNLNLTHAYAWGYTCVPAHLPHVKLLNLVCTCTAAWILLCSFVPVNTCNRWEMQVTSSDLICYTTCMVYRYSSCTVAIDNEIICFTVYQFLYNYVVINTILLFAKYVGVSLLINKWNCTVVTRVKLYTHSLNYIYSCFIFWKLVENWSASIMKMK